MSFQNDIRGRLTADAAFREALEALRTDGTYELFARQALRFLEHESEWDPSFGLLSRELVHDARFILCASDDPVLVGTAEAVITLEGGLYRGDWFEVEGAINISGQLNDHYLDASAEVEVKVVVEIDIEGGGINVSDIVLEDVPTAPRNCADQLQFDVSDVESPHS